MNKPFCFMLRQSVLQRIIQSGFLIFCIYTGWQFYRFVLWATGASEIFVPRPASVEAFLPIAALMSLRRLRSTGAWDSVHPAGLAIFLAAIATALVLRKGFCGYICPIGLISGLFNTLGQRLKLSRVPRPWIGRILSIPKYLTLGFFLFTVYIGMDLAALEQFAAAPYNYVADARMLRFFLEPTRLTLIVLGVLVVLGTTLRSFWCRYLCPYGALLGLFSWFGPTRIHREEQACINCGRCSDTCPGCIRVHAGKTMLSPECLGCGRCVEGCPVGCLSVRTAGRKIPAWTLGIGSVGILLFVWIAALTAGVWNQNIPLPMIRRFYQMFLE